MQAGRARALKRGDAGTGWDYLTVSACTSSDSCCPRSQPCKEQEKEKEQAEVCRWSAGGDRSSNVWPNRRTTP